MTVDATEYYRIISTNSFNFNYDKYIHARSLLSHLKLISYLMGKINSFKQEFSLGLLACYFHLIIISHISILLYCINVCSWIQMNDARNHKASLLNIPIEFPYYFSPPFFFSINIIIIIAFIYLSYCYWR